MCKEKRSRSNFRICLQVTQILALTLIETLVLTLNTIPNFNPELRPYAELHSANTRK